MPSRDRRLGTWLARPGGMKKLQARFHPPFAEGRAYIVVGHVVEEAGETELVTRVEAAPTLGRHDAPATILATLRHLVAVTKPRSLERLGSLRSRFWSFVPIGSDVPDVQDA